MSELVFDIQRFAVYGSYWNDTLTAESNSYVYAYDGNDYIYTGSYNYVTVDAGAGNDTIYNYWGWYSSLNGGAGNDKIYLNSGNSQWGITAKGGYGNDTIFGDTSNYNSGITYQFTAGDGYDWIYNYKSVDTISLGGYYSSNYYTRETIGSSVVISLLSGGAMTLSGASGKTINVANGILTIPTSEINNYTTYNLVSGTSSADTINNYAGGATVRGGAGNDYIYNSTNSNYKINGSYGYVTIDGGDGNDTIYSYDPLVSINGGAGADRISIYSGSYNGTITVKSGTGNDTVFGDTATSGSGVIYQFTAGDGYDSILNFNSNDTISLSGDTYSRSTVNGSVIISLLSGGAMTLSGASGKTINVANGILTIPTSEINNYTTYSLVSGTSSADTINNYAGGATIRGNKGNDYIYNSTLYTIKSSYGYVTIDGGDGNDTIYSFDPYVSINGGAGADKISVYSSSNYNGITIKGGTGNDTIYGNSLNGGVLYQYQSGDGNDLIYGFTASDSLSISGSSYTTTTSNNDILVKVGNSNTITLNGAKGKAINIYPKPTSQNGVNIYNTTSDKVLTGTKYADTIKNNLAGGVTINAGKGNDTIYNYADKVTINGGDGKDSLTGSYSNSKINGDNDNDLISLTGSYWRNTIDGGAGKDTIYAGGDEHSVNGGAGADKISLTGDKLTVNGGAGNDTIYGSTSSSNLYQYAKGDGNDIIYNYGSNDSITISGSTWTTSKSGNDVLVKVANSGTITLNGAKGKTLNIYPAKKPAPTPTTEDSITQQDVIKKFMHTLDTTRNNGIAALNEAVSVATGGYFSDIDSATRQMVADCRNTNNATAFLKDYCDMDLNNDDTGAITGKDAGGSSVDLTPENIVPESGSLDRSFNKTSFSTNYGLNFYLAKTSNLTYDELYIWRALKTWWGNAALNLIKNSYDYSFTDSDASVKNITVIFEEDYSSRSYLAYTGWPKYINGIYTRVLGINKAYYNGFSSTDVDGKSPNGQGYLDRTVSHELTHAVMMSKVSSFSDLPQFVTEGTAELVHGIDDFRGGDISLLAGNPSLLQNSLALIPGTGSDVPYGYAGGYMFFRYLAKQGSEHYGGTGGTGSFSILNNGNDSDSVTVKGSLLTVGKNFYKNMLDLSAYSSVKSVNASILANGIMIVGNQKANSILAGSGNDTISGNTGNDTILGGTGNDVIFGNADNDKLFGEAGNDTLYGGEGNDTLTGGDGKDIFVHTADNEYITDYKAGEDKIKFIKENASITSASIGSSGDLILTITNSDLITIKGGKGKEITFINYKGDETKKTYSVSTTDDNSGTSKTFTVSNSTKSPVTVSADIEVIDASKRTTAVKITGNKLANTISGGSKNDLLYGGSGKDSILGNAGNDKLYGQAGNDILKGGAGKDTLWGGKGNDSLWGDAGADKFIYASGDGKDIIYGFDKNDTLTLDSITFSTSMASVNSKKTEIYFKIGSVDKAITLKDFGSTSSFNINGTAYKISGSTLKKK